MKATAYGTYIFLKRDEEKTEANGLVIPDGARVKPNMGTILSVGALCGDKSAKAGKKALFNKSVALELDIDGEKITVLREEHLLGTM